MKYAAYLRDNPVILMDLAKYLVAALVIFKLPIPDGFDVALTGVILAVLTLITRSQVTPVSRAEQAIADALAMAPPTPDETGEAQYLAELSESETDDSTREFDRVE